MPTIQQLVRKGRTVIEEKSKSAKLRNEESGSCTFN